MKKLVVMCAPFSTRSGYGDHARSIYYSIMDRDDIDIKCLDVRWGTTPRNHLNPEVPRHKKLLDCFVDFEELKQQPDVYIDIRIPNEFANPGKFNIGITAGVETDVVSPEFLAGMNNMNLNIVPSTFTATTFKKCSYDQVEDTPDGQKQKTGDVKLDKPIEVLFEGVDINVYYPMDKYKIKSNFTNELTELIKEDFAYLHVGQWTKGNFGEDRNNIPLMIKCFLETFSSQVESLPNVYLIHGDLTIQEMAILYNHPKIRAFITCTHGEGFGRPMLEASCCDLPVIASKWSGHMDFLTDSDSLLINGFLKEVPKSALWKPIIVKPGKWFNVNEADVKRKLRTFYKKHKLIERKARRLGKNNRRKYSLNKMAEKFNKILDNVLASIPSSVNLKLPKLKKVGSEKSKSQTTIKLPKLKKAT